MIITSGVAMLTSAVTGEAFPIDPVELHWQTSSRGDARLGLQHLSRVERLANDGSTVACQWTVAEFPLGTLGHVAHHSTGGTLTQNFQITIKSSWKK